MRAGAALLRIHQHSVLATRDFMSLSTLLQSIGRDLWHADKYVTSFQPAPRTQSFTKCCRSSAQLWKHRYAWRLILQLEANAIDCGEAIQYFRCFCFDSFVEPPFRYLHSCAGPLFLSFASILGLHFQVALDNVHEKRRDEAAATEACTQTHAEGARTSIPRG